MQNYTREEKTIQNYQVRHFDIFPFQVLRAVRFSVLVVFFLFIVPSVMFLFRKALHKKVS